MQWRILFVFIDMICRSIMSLLLLAHAPPLTLPLALRAGGSAAETQQTCVSVAIAIESCRSSLLEPRTVRLAVAGGFLNTGFGSPGQVSGESAG